MGAVDFWRVLIVIDLILSLFFVFFIPWRLSQIKREVHTLPGKLRDDVIPTLQTLVAEIKRFADSVNAITLALTRLENKVDNHARNDDKDHKALAEKVKELRETRRH